MIHHLAAFDDKNLQNDMPSLLLHSLEMGIADHEDMSSLENCLTHVLMSCCNNKNKKKIGINIFWLKEKKNLHLKKNQKKPQEIPIFINFI